MIPPPAMTTSALSMPEHAPKLEDQFQSGKGRDIAVVVWRRDLNHVESHQLRACCGHSQEVDRLPGAQTPGGWDLRARSEGRVEGVDVERNVQALACERLGGHAGGSPAARQLGAAH